MTPVDYAVDPAVVHPRRTLEGALTGTLVGFADDGRTPLVTFAESGGTAVRARAIIDLHGSHIGRRVVLLFDRGDASAPIVMGLVREDVMSAELDRPGHVEVDADGQRLLVTAKERLVLRCGRASITLTKAGKVLIEGTYVLSYSSGVNRVKGGSVHLN
jgi:hypothetical protein